MAGSSVGEHPADNREAAGSSPAPPTISYRAAFDNPATCNREAWLDGRLFAWASWEVLASRDMERLLDYCGPRAHIAALAAIGRFESGRIAGDPEAIAPAQRPLGSFPAAHYYLRVRETVFEDDGGVRERTYYERRPAGCFPLAPPRAAG